MKQQACRQCREASIRQGVFEPVYAAMAGLPEEQRCALVLVGVESLGCRDAAAALAIPSGSLMS